MRCYNLVFNLKIFVHNYGSILIFILFIIYFVFLLYFCFKEINPLKVKVSKILFDESNEEKETNVKYQYKSKSTTKSNEKKNLIDKKKKRGNNPPKKAKAQFHHEHNNNYETIIAKTEEKKLVGFKRNFNKNSTNKTTLREGSSRNVLTNIEFYKNSKTKSTVDSNENKPKRKNLDNFKLNNLDYYDACELDKRSCCKTYWSVLMREHTALITFFACHDYNLFYIKIQRFFILFCVDMTMNGLFFVHESMHKKYNQGENFTFVQKLPQLLFTLIGAHILEVILCYLSLTDVHVYEIKALPPQEKKNGQKIMDIISCIQRKITAFIIFTFILFRYFISAFCAVYQNTQKIYLRDSMISFAISMLDPFIIYSFTSLLRRISLTKLCRKNCCGSCLFKISDLIPIF